MEGFYRVDPFLAERLTIGLAAVFNRNKEGQVNTFCLAMFM